LRRTNNENLNGLPTAIRRLGLFAFAGCLAPALFLLVMAAFLWVWMRVCDWTGLSASIPSHAGRVWLGVLEYLIAVPVCAVLWKNSQRTPAEAAARKEAREKRSATRDRSAGNDG
jgi:hypothetical protein